MIDFGSDTVTKPTAAMRERMATAKLGDDGRDGDPTVAELEAMAAERLGKDAAVYVPSGTMGNLIAVLTHTGRAGEVIGEATSHIFRSELGGVALVAGLFPRPLPGRRGAVDIEALSQALRPPQLRPHALGTALVCMESSHNAAGGAVLPLAHMAEMRRLTAELGVPLHLDGARIFNAAVALGVNVREIAQQADSVMFCVSKGLSAPVGSLLTGSRAFIERARGFRRILGGNMRQSGLLAACGIVALEQMVDRLADDHANAKALAEGIHAFAAGWVDPALVETNIVMVRAAGERPVASRWCAKLAEQGILTAPATPSVIRLVTHRHIGPAEIEAAIAAFRSMHNSPADL